MEGPNLSANLQDLQIHCDNLNHILTVKSTPLFVTAVFGNLDIGCCFRSSKCLV